MKKKENEKKKITKKQKLVICFLISLVLVVLALIFIILKPKRKPEENKNNTIPPVNTSVNNTNELVIKENLSYEINSELFIPSLIENNNITIKNGDEKIDTSKLGEQEVIIKYLLKEEDQEKKVTVNIVDTIAPEIEYKTELTTTVNKKIDLLKGVKVTDNSKEEIKATVLGEYNFKKEGTYNLKYVAIDSSNNRVEKEFTLKVTKNNNASNNTSTNEKPTSSNNNTNSENSNDDDLSEEIETISKEEFRNKSVDFTLSPYLTTIQISWNYDKILPFNSEEWVDYEITLTGSNKNLTINSSHRGEYELFRDLELNTTYTISVKAYQKDSNGKTVYTKETKKSVKTLSSPNYSSADQAYVDNLFNLLNSNKGNIYKRDASLDLAASICASSSMGLKARACLQKAGVNKEVLAWRDTRHSATSGYVSYQEFYQENKEFFDKNAYARIGVGYYKGIVHVISVSFRGD